MTNDLFKSGDPFDDPAWKAAEKLKPPRGLKARYIGCSVEWLKRILPIVHSRDQLAVALWLNRQRIVRKSDLVTVSNCELRDELGISRFTKYRTLWHLEVAGCLKVLQVGKRATTVQLLPDFLD